MTEINKTGATSAPMTWDQLKADAQKNPGTSQGFAETMAQIREMRTTDEPDYKQARLEGMNGNKTNRRDRREESEREFYKRNA